VKLDVHFGAATLAAADVQGRVVAVIDVLRASTTIAVALTNGARAVIPFLSADEVLTRSKAFERGEVRLAGERRMLPIPGFDLGNSPSEFTPEAVEGKTVLIATTNGTAALIATQGARDAVVASYVNFSAALAFLRTAARSGTDVAIVCAGRDRYFSLEDAACAGRYVRGVMRRLPEAELNDAAQSAALLDRRYGDDLSRLFADSEHGRSLVAAGFEADLAVCAALDSHAVLPIYTDRQVVKLGPAWQR
jgi:2-phosphosulfolactate phosphatase